MSDMEQYHKARAEYQGYEYRPGPQQPDHDLIKPFPPLSHWVRENKSMRKKQTALLLETTFGCLLAIWVVVEIACWLARVGAYFS